LGACLARLILIFGRELIETTGGSVKMSAFPYAAYPARESARASSGLGEAAGHIVDS
jgi:hypothetical protein